MDKYTIEKVLGDGGHAIVNLAKRKSDDEYVVMKIIKKGHIRYNTRSGIPKEVSMMKRLKDVPNVCKLHDWFKNNDGTCVLIIEYVPDSVDLFSYINNFNYERKLDEKTAMIIFKNLFKIVLNIHRLGYVHRDIKPENVLVKLDTLDVVLIDFDSTSRIKTPFTTFNGTSVYYPPEWWIRSRYDAEAMTVWSLGCTLFQMLDGDIPFHAKVHICNTDRQMNSFSYKMQKLLRCMLLKDPHHRYTFNDIINSLYEFE